MDLIDFRQLPLSGGGFSELFFDYLYAFEEVKNFYPHNFRDSHAHELVMKGIGSQPIDRVTLTRVLTEQNTTFGSSRKTFDNIGLLQRQNTFAVVTGQQVGLFGGPLYTTLKTITTIKTARALKEKYPAYEFVPVFWIEGEDHDFDEMNNVSVFDSENSVARIQYLPGGAMPERNLGPIGELVLDSSIDATFVHVEQTLQKTEFTDDLLAILKSCYKEGRTFSQSFAAWLNFLFGEHGLVFVSSNHPHLKKLLSPLFVRELSDFPKTSQIVIARSAELEQKYHAQVKPKSVNLFLFHKGGRYAIEPRENDFSLRGTRHFIPKEELLRIAQETPELLSPNVILRPLSQDTLLPTVAYIGGPSEIAYHAQLAPLYEFFQIPQPVIHPRISSSLIEERLVRAMEKYQLNILEFMDDPDRVTTKVLGQIAAVRLEDIFGKALSAVYNALNELKFGLKEIDQTLLGALDNVRSKIDGNMSNLKEKAISAQKRRNETALRQIEKAARGLLPNGKLQEREISIVYYLNKYGPELIKSMYNQLEVTAFKHQILIP